MWCKMSTLELGTRIPMIFRAPWIAASVNVKTAALAEAVDLYPTLSDLAGLILPTGVGGEYLGGVSLLPVFKDPSRRKPLAGVKNATLSQFPRCFQNNTHYQGRKPGDENNRTTSWETMSDCHWTDRGFLDFMGWVVRCVYARGEFESWGSAMRI
jgi:iduronate 2-sulfatase